LIEQGKKLEDTLEKLLDITSWTDYLQNVQITNLLCRYRRVLYQQIFCRCKGYRRRWGIHHGEGYFQFLERFVNRKIDFKGIGCRDV